MGKPEAYVEHYLRDRCKERGWLCYKFTSPANAGVPDRIVIGNGRVVFVELKSAVGKLSKIQEVQIRRMREQGADVRVINSRKLVDALIKEIEDEVQIDEEAGTDAAGR